MAAEPSIDYEAEYNNRARVPAHPEIMAGWQRDAAAYRTEHPPEIIAYGSGARENIDLFRAGENAPVAMFIHGGYWQALDGTWFSHMARGLNAHGISIAIPTYDLCPNVSIAQILDQMRAATLEIHRLTGQRAIATGHSAGGHLAACLLATDWQTIDSSLPPDLVPAAYCISGLFDLRPLVTTSLNTALKLDLAEAERLSPLFWPPPRDAKLHAVVGECESSEYHRQSRELAQRWSGRAAEISSGVIAGANHFTVIAPLAQAESRVTREISILTARCLISKGPAN